MFVLGRYVMQQRHCLKDVIRQENSSAFQMHSLAFNPNLNMKHITNDNSWESLFLTKMCFTNIKQEKQNIIVRVTFMQCLRAFKITAKLTLLKS